MTSVFCRTCLNSAKTLISIDSQFIHNYDILTSITITLSDNKPRLVCVTCYEVVESFSQFREKCILSEKSLDELFEVKPKKFIVKLEKCDENVEIKNEEEEQVSPLNIENISLGSESDFEYKTVTGKRKDKKNVATKTSSLIESCMASDSKKDTCNIITGNLKMFLLSEDALGCGLCLKTFAQDDNENLNLHIETHRSQNQCEICAEYNVDWPAAIGHRVKHLCRKRQRCHICNKHFATDVGMEYHYRKQHCDEKDPDFTCKWCSKSFDLPRNLRRHIDSQHMPAKKLYKCKFCPKLLKTRQALRLHESIHSDKKDYVCDDCGFSCKLEQSLRLHIQRMHLKMVFCNRCNRRFNDRDAFVDHQCTAKYVLCPACGKQVLSSVIKKHMDVHSEIGRFNCKLCPAVYKSRNALREHLDRHEGNKRHECQDCHRKFYVKSTLLKHRRIHTGEKPYTCKVCGRGFTGGHNLKVHMKVHGENLVKKKVLKSESDDV